ncbi:Leucine Rich Repeat [Seminavis robusta]|uniref:Leucine Rich Repeat n=1 Tax=Seminavis robusta TaxID=568900 RepID=A0A9N8EH72_9STRA|nr:Leucine Rich Repeat [Seminavis robusta]|eukprot:Sro998_g229490.1 Leucine Rich Repeat (618) ;mRNA; r:5282-7135
MEAKQSAVEDKAKESNTEGAKEEEHHFDQPPLTRATGMHNEEEHHVDQPPRNESHRLTVAIRGEAKNQNHEVKDTNDETSDHHGNESRLEYYSDQRERIVRHVLGEDVEDDSSFHGTVEKSLVGEGRKEGAKNEFQRVLVANERQQPEDDSGGYAQGQQRRLSQVGAFAVGGVGEGEETSGARNNHSDDNNNEAVIDGAVLVSNAMCLADQTVLMEEGTNHIGNKQEVIEGTIMHSSDGQRRNVYPWLGVAFLVVTGMVVFLALYLPSSSNSSSGGRNKSQTVHNAANNSLIIYPPFQDDLPTTTLKAILNTSTHEYLANAWMWNDPNFASYSHERQLQRFDLVFFFYLTDGPGWFRNDHWLSYDRNECDWFTQAQNESIMHYDNYPVCDQNNTLRILNLNSNNLQGTLPVVNRFLENMLTFDIGNNQLHGAVPTGAAAANEVLEVFIVSNNHFEGQLLSSGGFRPLGIRVVKLDDNFLLGYNDPLFLFLNNLEILDVSGNLFGRFGSKILETIRSPSLRYFGSTENLYTGTIPTALGFLPALETVDVRGNAGLFGSIPTELGELTNLALLDVSYTNISGPVPTKLCERVETGLLEIRANCSLVVCCSVNSTLPNRS